MDPKKFMNSPAGQLVERTGNDGQYYAFVPNPLPPDIHLDNDTVTLLSNAMHRIGLLAGWGGDLANPKLLLAPLLRQEALLSSRIEGTFSTLSDVYAYEAAQLKLPLDDPEEVKRIENAREVSNYISAMEYAEERLETLPISKRLFLELHSRLLEGVRGKEKTPGKFRRVQNAIGSEGDSLVEARYVPPPAREMMFTLNDLEIYINEGNDLPPLVRLAFIHYQFEAIHPFLDGNGRIGRLILPLLLNQWKLLPFPMLYLSVFFEQHRQLYYDRLLSVSQSGEWKQWLHFFLDAVIAQSVESLELINKIKLLRIDWRRRLETKRTSANLLQLVENLFQSPMVSIPQVSRMLDITWRAANNMVSRLVSDKVLFPLPNTKNPRLYYAKELFELLEFLD